MQEAQLMASVAVALRTLVRLDDGTICCKALAQHFFISERLPPPRLSPATALPHFERVCLEGWLVGMTTSNILPPTSHPDIGRLSG